MERKSYDPVAWFSSQIELESVLLPRQTQITENNPPHLRLALHKSSELQTWIRVASRILGGLWSPWRPTAITPPQLLHWTRQFICVNRCTLVVEATHTCCGMQPTA